MSDFFPPPPYFGDGQRVSASAHLNGLKLSTLYLLGMYQGGRVAWAHPQVDPPTTSDGWRRVYDGYLRKKSNTLGYTIRAEKDSGSARTIRIMYGDTDLTPHLSVAAGTGIGTVSGTKDLSAFTTGQFYPLQVDVQGGAVWPTTVNVFHLAEHITPSYPTLYAFASGTPTAAEWQALATAMNLAQAQMLAPRPMFPRRHLGRNARLKATLRHRTSTLLYQIDFQSPYRDDTRQFSMFLHIYYNGTLAATVGGNDVIDGFTAAASTTVALKNGSYCFEGDVLRTETGELILLGSKSGATFTGCTRGYQNTAAGDCGDGMMAALWHPGALVWGEMPWSYRGTVDLSGLGLTADTDYEVEVFTESDSYLGGDEVSGRALVVGLGEQEDDFGLPTWWAAMPEWAHGEVINGTNGVKLIRDNLAALALKANYYNYPAMRNATFGGWNIRRHRWLHYRCEPVGEKSMKPTLSYFAEGKQEVSLPYEANKWLKYDLEGARGLYMGTAYELHDLTCALEDSEV